MDVVGQIVDASGLNRTNWIYPSVDIPMTVYKIEWLKMQHNHILLQDGSYVVQYTHTYSMVRCLIIYVKYDDLQFVINNVGYWEGMPQVEPMVPGSDLGYFKISGTFIKKNGCII